MHRVQRGERDLHIGPQDGNLTRVAVSAVALYMSAH